MFSCWPNIPNIYSICHTSPNTKIQLSIRTLRKHSAKKCSMIETFYQLPHRLPNEISNNTFLFGSNIIFGKEETSFDTKYLESPDDFRLKEKNEGRRKRKKSNQKKHSFKIHTKYVHCETINGIFATTITNNRNSVCVYHLY